MSALQLLALVLLLAVVTSGLQVVYSSHDVRALHAELQSVQQRQDAELAKHSRLLLERSVQISYANVEHVAEAHLDMVFPDVVEQVQP